MKRTPALQRPPWERLGESSAQLMEDQLTAITEEILSALAREIPDYTRPLEGAFGDAVRGGVGQALRQFAAMIRDPDTALREEGRRVYVALGRGEVAAGRSIGALLAAYRLGAQIAWRRLAEAAVDAGLEQRETNLLAESIFAYIDELSAESAEGFAQAQAERAGELDVRRAELIDLLTRGRIGADPRALATAAAAADWSVPDELAVLTWSTSSGRAPLGRLPQGAIARGDENVWIALVPRPRDGAHRRQLAAAFRDLPGGLGSAAPPHLAFRSYAHSRAMLTLAERSGEPGLWSADEHRPALIAGSDHLLAERITADLLAPLEGETEASRERLTATLLSWLRHDGNVAAAAAELHVHEQTLRYRMNRLRELLGGVLDDPDRRYELEFALRSAS